MRLATGRPAYLQFFLFALVATGLPLGCQRRQPEAEKTPPAPVKWLEARQCFVEEWTEIVGNTQPLPDHVARVSAAVEGIVEVLLQDATGKPMAEGQRVKKGDVLVQLDARLAQLNREKLEADLEELRQQIQQAQLLVKLDEIEVRRLETLLKESSAKPSGVVLASPVDLERAKVTLDEAKSKQRGAELRLKAGEKQLKVAVELLSRYSLTAPISGRLGRILVVRGQTLAIGAPVVEILDLDDQIDLLCFVPPEVRSKLREGQPVRVGGLEDNNTVGRVIYIADQAEVDTGNFAVKVRFPNGDLKLRGNLTVRARVMTAPGKAALTLPEAAVMEDQDPPVVVVVENHQEEVKDGKTIETGVARRLRVKLGVRDRVLHLVEILGLDDPEKKWQGTMETAKFVVERGHGIRNGDAIKLEEEEEEEPQQAEGKEGKP